jgi:hypothetical protein
MLLSNANQPTGAGPSPTVTRSDVGSSREIEASGMDDSPQMSAENPCLRVAWRGFSVVFVEDLRPDALDG